MEIHASLLAANIFDQENWINQFAAQIDAFHVDIIDPSFANFVGIDYRIIPKLAQMEHKFYIHYMAKWNDDLIKQMVDAKPAGMFFHQSRIENRLLFEQLSAFTKIGVALELGEMPSFDVEHYLLMNVKLGYCGQEFNDANIELSHKLKKQGKTVFSDGGIKLEHLDLVKHFDAIVIGNTLNTTPIGQIYEKLK